MGTLWFPVEKLSCFSLNIFKARQTSSKCEIMQQPVEKIMHECGTIRSTQSIADLLKKIPSDKTNFIAVVDEEGKFMEKERLEFDDAIDWVYDLSRRFYFQEGLGDQFYGIAITDTIAKKGLRQIKCQKFSKAESSEIYQNFKGMMWDQRLVLYDWPLPNEPGKAHCPYIAELLELQAEEHSKYVIEVHKPPMPDKFDDMSDALVRMVWLASQGIGSAKRVSGSYGSASPQAPVSSMESMQRKALLRAHRPGSDPARMPARYHPGGRYTAGRRG